MPDAPKPAPDASTTILGRALNSAETTLSDAAHAVVDTVSGVVHKATAVQTWSAIGHDLEPVFAQTLGPALADAEKSVLTLVDPQHLAGYEAAFGSLAASGLKALLARIAIPAVAAATTAP